MTLEKIKNLVKTLIEERIEKDPYSPIDVKYNHGNDISPKKIMAEHPALADYISKTKLKKVIVECLNEMKLPLSGGSLYFPIPCLERYESCVITADKKAIFQHETISRYSFDINDNFISALEKSPVLMRTFKNGYFTRKKELERKMNALEEVFSDERLKITDSDELLFATKDII